MTLALFAAPIHAQFRSGVELVTVDAAVHDDDGSPVTTLTAQDFRVEVDGRQRPVVSAQFVVQSAEARSAKADALRASADRLLRSVSHFSSNEGIDVGRVIVVAVDEMHIRRLEGKHALVAATRFIESLPETDHVGVVGLSNADTLLLTRDRVALRKSLERMTGIGDPQVQQLNLGISEALEISEGSRARLADAVLRECGRALTEYISAARLADDAGASRDACPEQVEQESRAMAQFAHMQAGISVGALQALIARLKDLPGPKTIVLVSEGMIVDPRRVDLSRLAAAAQAARVTIYGLHLDVPVFEAGQDRVSPTAARDVNVREDGVARVAGAARGAVFRQVGTDPRPFERITREISGYYLLAFEARDGDRDGKPHRIRVSLSRGKGQLRARTGFTLPPLTLEARGAELTTLLRSPSLVTELPLRVATYAYAEPNAAAEGAESAQKRVRVVISAEAGDRRSGTWLGFVLIDSSGVIAATATQQARDGRYSFSAAVPPGTYVLRAAAVDALGRQGSVERVFRVIAGAANAVHVGDLMLAPPPAAPGDPLEPFVDRVSGDTVIAYLETHSGTGAPRPDAVRIVVAPEGSDSATMSATSRIAAGDGGWAVARAPLSIASLAPGLYVARAEVLAGGAVVGRAVRPFSISR